MFQLLKYVLLAFLNSFLQIFCCDAYAFLPEEISCFKNLLHLRVTQKALKLPFFFFLFLLPVSVYGRNDESFPSIFDELLCDQYP